MKQYDIYIDGSHLNKQNNGRLGIGGVLVDLSGPGEGSIINEFSIELTPEYMKENFDADKCSNPSAELTALLQALKKFKGNYEKNGNFIINIHADYLGVKEWMTGNWKIKEPYILKIKEEIDKEIKSQVLQNKITYKWVKGHQKYTGDPDVYWNNYVDLLAKGKK